MPVIEVRHPLVRHKVGLLREASLSTKSFREITAELGRLLTYEATADFPLESVQVQCWSGPIQVDRISGKKVTVVPILRAGVGMLDGVLAMIPVARVGFLGMYRDEQTLQPVVYYSKLPGELSEREILLLDPMLATGGSAVDAVRLCKAEGARSVRLLSIIAAPEGIEALHAAHPDVEIYCASIDRQLNEVGYILPGLGDAGDRIWGTR
jgi:uracil phosphoribosyltransferase